MSWRCRFGWHRFRVFQRQVIPQTADPCGWYWSYRNLKCERCGKVTPFSAGH